MTLLHLLSHAHLRLVQQSPRLDRFEERTQERFSVGIGRGDCQGFTQRDEVFSGVLEDHDGEDQRLVHGRSVANRAGARKPKQLDTDLGRPVFWVALIIALYLWAWTTGFAWLQLALTGGALVLGMAVHAVQLAEDERRAVEQRIRAAMKFADLSVNAASICYYGKPDRTPDFEKALKGERPLDVARLEILLGDEFARHYATLTLIEKGPPTYIRKALKVLPMEGAL
jgi:hypothetical protein